ncbi:hypothetical protein LBMAG57_29840 [Verrucomicrobiota bacterium]|nr:hypothetical protein LBMAG57_29840 [Verrucomicrobiota bacterium]
MRNAQESNPAAMARFVTSAGTPSAAGTPEGGDCGLGDFSNGAREIPESGLAADGAGVGSVVPGGMFSVGFTSPARWHAEKECL